MMFISVDLPLPEGPMTLTNSFGKMCERHMVERVDALLADLVDLGNVM